MADAAPAHSLYAIRLRVARLDASGVPLVGADNAYVTDALVRFDYAPTIEEGDRITKKNGRGKLCLNVKADDELTGLDVTLELCSEDPKLEEMIAGGSILESTGDVVGYQLPKRGDAATNGVSIEIWTEAYNGGDLDPDAPYFRWVFPKVKLRRGDRSLAAEPDEKVFVGTGEENGNWGNGPFNDWTWDSSASGQFVRTAVAPPTSADDYVTVPAAV